MNRLTNEQRLQIVEFYYELGCSVRKVHRALLPFYGQFNRPTEAAIRAIVTKFRTKFTLLDIKPETRARRVRTEENIAAVSASVNDDHLLSIRRRSQQLGLCYSTTWKILHKDLVRQGDCESSQLSGQDMNQSAKLLKCVQFAAQKHKNQRRKDADGTPYINHPINVATILAVEGGIEDEEVLQAALLHDTVEDTDASFEELEEHFGKNVCGIVREVTDDKSLPKAKRKRLQILHAASVSTKAKLVKLADKLDNLRDLQRVLPVEWTEQRREDYFVWAKKVVDNLRGTNEQLESKLDEIFKAKNLV